MMILRNGKSRKKLPIIAFIYKFAKRKISAMKHSMRSGFSAAIKSLMLLWLLFVNGLMGHSQNSSAVVNYLGGDGDEGLLDVIQLSNGQFLACGYAENLNWVAATVPKTEISPGNIVNTLGTNRFGVMLLFSSDLQQLLHVVHFPQGAVEDIRFIKTDALPGSVTGNLFISGNTLASDAQNGGYFLARLNNNFVNGIPTGLAWQRNVWAKSYARAYHPWDVNAEGEVVHITGEAHGYDWSAVYWLDAVGNRKVVEHWRTHQPTNGGEWYGSPASSYSGGALAYSLMALKAWGRCELRSWNDEDFNWVQSDGNGGQKKGKWPMDVLFSGPCDPQNPQTNGPGYTGYSLEACCPVYGGSAVAFDKRTGKLYLGFNMKSVGPTGSPDFEPAVVAMSATGELEWWSRLYHEIQPDGDTVVSIPDQYVDALAVDYSQPPETGLLTVAARSHGNNIENLWEGNSIAINPDANGFQNQFTGTNGDIHLSWLGKLKLSTGDLMHATYVGEYSDASPNLGIPIENPLLDQWPNPNSGWPNLNTTYIQKNQLKTTADGSVCIIGEGRRTITTSNAYQKMVKPGFGGVGTWNHFVRVYTPELNSLKYSSLLTGVWDTLTGTGGANVTLNGLWKTSSGLVVVGVHEKDNNGQSQGNAMPTTTSTLWSSNQRLGETGVLAFFPAESMTDPNDGPGVVTSTKQQAKALLKVWPNPATSFIQVFSNTANDLELYDTQGRIVKHFSNNPDSVNTIQLEGVLPGFYILKKGNMSTPVVIVP